MLNWMAKPGRLALLVPVRYSAIYRLPPSITVYHSHLASKSRALPTQTGKQAEQLACDYLQARGLHLRAQNYRLRNGEIDLIMQDGPIIVFVEVRYRRGTAYGGALASIDLRKQQRLLHTAQHYLLYQAPEAQARFDVIAIEGNNDIQWIPNAFDLG